MAHKFELTVFSDGNKAISIKSPDVLMDIESGAYSADDVIRSQLNDIFGEDTMSDYTGTLTIEVMNG